MSVDDAQPLAKLKDHPNEFVRAVVEAEDEAENSDKETPTKDMLKDAVARQKRYMERQKNLAVSDLTYEESKTLDGLVDVKRVNPDLVKLAHAAAEKLGKTVDECLLSICDERHAIPSQTQLLTLARGDKLANLIGQLADLVEEWDKEDALQERAKELRQELSTVQRKAQS